MLASFSLVGNSSLSIGATTQSATVLCTTHPARFRFRFGLRFGSGTHFNSRSTVTAFLKRPPSSSSASTTDVVENMSSSVVHDSLQLLEWDQVCDAVASFATTALGRQATKAQLLRSVNLTYEESLKLLEETDAAMEILKYVGRGMDFAGVDVVLVKSALQHVERGLPVTGGEAMTIVALLGNSRALQCSIEAAIKEDVGWYNRFMPLTEVIMNMVINQSLVKSIQQAVDDNGSVKDSASSNLRKARHQVQMLEKKIYQLMDSLIRNEEGKMSSLEVTNSDGRLCVKYNDDQATSLKGLLLSSNSGGGSMLEPLAVVQFNDELQQARVLAAEAESGVLLTLTEKIQKALDEIKRLLFNIIELDVINARAVYSFSFRGTRPDLNVPENINSNVEALGNKTLKALRPTKKEWVLYLLKAYHPLLLWKHHITLQKAKENVKNATAEIKRRKQGENTPLKEETNINLSYLEMQVTSLEQSHPVPVDFFIANQTRVLVITGPNAGGKTLCLKTIGLAAMMAKSGLYVLASEPVRIPWFDSIFADIGDEQSLSHSLSTFSGHLKRISDIQMESSSRSLVLLDEVGSGTNPLEGTALGMSLLEYFAQRGALLTISTTHHGELKTLKYSNDAFENACMEFDEVSLKPTYRILWGIPGRSNAISIAERLGLPEVVLNNARGLYGTARTKINAVIIEMERLKQEFRGHFHETHQQLRLVKDLYNSLLVTERKIVDHGINQSYKKGQQISDFASVTRSFLRRKVQKLSAIASQPCVPSSADKNQQISDISKKHITTSPFIPDSIGFSNEIAREKPSEKRKMLPKVGDVVHLSSLKKKGTVLKVDPSKEEMLVLAGSMRLKLKIDGNI